MQKKRFSFLPNVNLTYLFQRKSIAFCSIGILLCFGYFSDVIDFQEPLLPPVWSFSNMKTTFYNSDDGDLYNYYNVSESVSYHRNNETKFILRWTRFNQLPINQDDFLATCPNANCEITFDRNLLYKSDALIFHLGDFKWNRLPLFRHWKQYYVFHTMESPHNSYFKAKIANDFFNLTMTYRKDSDFYFPYGDIVKKRHKQSQSDRDHLFSAFMNNVAEIVKKKTKLAAWWVSDCWTDSKREKVINQLKKRLHIDVYGYCGDLKCDKNTANCSEMLDQQYKFYFSFENSLCPDYVTEKLFTRIKHYVVPVILTKKFYINRLPPKSVVSMDEFRNINEFADYLLYLNGNFTAYLEYFQWRFDYDIIDYYGRCGRSSGCGYCELCKFLHKVHLPTKRISNIYRWWHEDAVCETDLVDKFLAKV